MTIYNGNINRFANARISLEILRTGKIQPSASFDTIRLFPYALSSERGILGIEIVMLLIFIWLFGKEILQLVYEKQAYFKDKWNYLDLTNYFLLIAVLIIRFISYGMMDRLNLEKTIANNPQANQYNKFDDIVSLTVDEHNVEAICILSYYYYRLYC